MEAIPQTRKDKMGELNNQIVELVDKSELTPLEVVTVLRMTVARVEQLIELAMTGGA